MPFIIPRWPFFVLALGWWLATKIVPSKTDSLKIRLGEWMRKNVMSSLQLFTILFLLYLLVVSKVPIYWDNFFPAFIATLLGVIFATSLNLVQVEVQQKKEAEQTRNLVHDTLLVELITHKEILKEVLRTINGQLYAQSLPVFHFDGTLSSGLYYTLDPILQEIVTRHYRYCFQYNHYVLTDGINRDIRINLDIRIREIKIHIREIDKEIDEVIFHVKEFR